MKSQPADLYSIRVSAGPAISSLPAFSKILYRTAVLAVLLACAVFLSSPGLAQNPEDTPQITPSDRKVKKKNDHGPRALGLLQISSNGKARLVPIAIRVDGKFYDATAYKAAPVPMSLDAGTVYEGEKTGASAGLFTIGGALHSTDAASPHPWIGTGTWLPAGTEGPKTGIKAETVPVGINDTDAPPRLTKPGSTPKSDSKTKADSTPSNDSAKPPADAKPTDKKEASSSESGEARGDETNRPRLRRGKPAEVAPDEIPGYSDPKKTKSSESAGENKPAGTPWKALQVLPAISDAGGPDPRSYAFEWGTSEAEDRHKQMLALANEQVLAYVANQAKSKIGPPAAKSKTVPARKPAKPAQPVLEDVKFLTFDPWTNNQPVLVLTAEAHMPPAAGASTASADAMPQYSITLVARTDIYSNLHTLYAGVTDKFHLDVTPRLDFIDVVDADGDGRGELLFQKTTDSGTGYILYRPTADKLWKMFDSLNPE